MFERRHLHAWPLSSVELLQTNHGEKLIYKVQLAPTVEPEVYDHVRSPLLLAHRTLTRDAISATMIIEHIDAPLLRDLDLDVDTLVAHGRNLVDAISALPADTPVYLDLGSEERWFDVVDATLAMLEDAAFDVQREHVNEVERWARSGPVVDLINRTSRVIHADLNTGNVFFDGTYHVIDWQRPCVAPADVDLVCLLERNPSLFDHVDARAIGVFYLLRMHWGVSQLPLLPDVRHIFEWWSTEAITFIRRAAGS